MSGVDMAEPGERERRRARGGRRGVPMPGLEVGGYRLEKKLGEGSFGTVYRARRGGCEYAVKFISLARAERWGKRELQAMARLPRECGAALEGHGLWPDESPSFLWLAMRYVRGRPLDVWVEETNPTGLEVARQVLGVAEELGKVHAAGVVHRDVKEANILVREADGQPVLVDFGVATYGGAPEVTGPFPPGTWLYLSPEVMRHQRELRLERYQALASDDLWALGVVLYRMLTHRYPFDAPHEGRLAEAILHEEPPPPRVANPRVPGALSELCMRLLAKSLQARYPDAGALAEALKAALKERDASWDVPLCEPWRPDDAPTVAVAEMAGDLQEQMVRWRRVAGYEQGPPRRGRPRAPPSEDGCVPVRASGWRRAAKAGGVLLLSGLALLAAVRLGAVFAPEAAPGRHGGMTGVPEVSSARMPWEEVREVAPPWKPPEVGGGAMSMGDSTPAPLAPQKNHEEKRVMTPRKNVVANGKQKSGISAELLKRCAWAVTAAQLAACVSTGGPPPPPSGPGLLPTPPPPPRQCEPGIEQRMLEQFKFGVGKRGTALLVDPRGPDYTIVREGPIALWVGGRWGRLDGNFTVHGWLTLGKDRLYGHITRLVTKEGESYPVCMVMLDQADLKPGVLKKPDSGPDYARVFATVILEAVSSFNE
jgi:serine/threonine protein kinase